MNTIVTVSSRPPLGLRFVALTFATLVIGLSVSTAQGVEKQGAVNGDAISQQRTITGNNATRVENDRIANDLTRPRIDSGINGCSEARDRYADSVGAYGCQVEAVLPNAVADGSFEAGEPNPFWTESSANFGTPICSPATCGLDIASDGLWYVWFGGIPAYEAASVSQALTVPSNATTLEFDLLIGACDSPADYMNVTIDGNVVFSTGSCTLTPGGGYETHSVDIGTYADGGPHTLAFESESFSTNGNWASIFVDNIIVFDGRLYLPVIMQ